MANVLYQALNVRPDEQGRVLLLLANGFFMGIFMATYQLVSETLLINELGEYISEGIFVAGLLGVFTTAFFAYLQNKIPYSKLAVLNLLGIFFITSILLILLNYTADQYRPIIVFSLYAIKGPLIAVILLGFWGVFGRMFDLRQSKRIIGGIDTGQLSAAIITFFTIGLTPDLLPQTEDLLIVSAVSVIISLIFMIIISKKFDINVVKIIEGAKSRKTTIYDLFKNNYVVLLSLFLSFSVIAFLIVENSYLSVLNDQYPSDKEKELTSFLGWFNGSILVLSFIFQTFFNDRIIANYGLKISLLILPIILGFFTVISIIVGTMFGYTVESPNFFWFFLFIALSKLFTTFLRDALENPTFKLFFMPLDNRIRFDIQAKVEGVVNEFAKFIAGGIILLLGLLAFFELIHYSYFLILIIIGWAYITEKLYNEYRNRIKTKLEGQEVSSERLIRPQAVIIEELQSELDHKEPEKVIFSFRLLEKINPSTIGPSINKLMKHPNNEIKQYAQHRMNEIRGLSVSESYIISFNPSGYDGNGQQIVSGLDLENLFRTGDISKKRIANLSRSEKVEDRLYAAELIGNSTDKDTAYLLVELLHDFNPKVRVAAMNAAEKNYNEEILNSLIENLQSPKFSNMAMNTLVSIGAKALNTLESNFYKVGQNIQVMLKILQIYGRIGGNKAKNLLWNKIDFPDKILVSQVLDSLGDCGFKASLRQITRIKYAIELDISDIAWNLAALNEIPQGKIGDQLREAIREENEYDIEHIYVLLSMLYDARSIQLVKENLESGSSEGITYAIELLDVFLSEDLKQKIIPIVDDIPDSDKAKKLEVFYPRNSLNSKEVLKFLINRDINQTNRWSKTCALYLIGVLKIKEYTYDIIANLFNQDKMVKEISGWALYNIDPALYETHTKRLDTETKQQFDQLILNKNRSYKRSLKYEKVLFLKSMNIFSQTYGRILANLADVMEELFIKEGDSYSLSESNKDNFYFVFKGNINFYSQGSMMRTIKEGSFIGELLEENTAIKSNFIMAQSDAVLLKVDKDRFYELLSDNFSFANNVIDYMYAS